MAQFNIRDLGLIPYVKCKRPVLGANFARGAGVLTVGKGRLMVNVVGDINAEIVPSELPARKPSSFATTCVLQAFPSTRAHLPKHANCGALTNADAAKRTKYSSNLGRNFPSGWPKQ